MHNEKIEEKIKALNAKIEELEKETLDLQSKISKKHSEAKNLAEGFKKYDKNNPVLASQIKQIFSQKIDEGKELKEALRHNRLKQQKLMQEAKKFFAELINQGKKLPAVKLVQAEAPKSATIIEDQEKEPVREKKEPEKKEEVAAPKVPAVRVKKEENLYSKAHSAQQAEEQFMKQISKCSKDYGAA